MEKLRLADFPPAARTLLIPLAYRAMESRRPDALLRDKRAEELLARFEEDLPRSVKPLRMEQTATMLRARKFDSMARGFLEQNPDGAVVDLGCGLACPGRRPGIPAQAGSTTAAGCGSAWTFRK